MLMSRQRIVPSLEMISVFTGTAFTVLARAPPAAVGTVSPRTQPKVITANAETKDVSPIQFTIVLSFARR